MRVEVDVCYQYDELGGEFLKDRRLKLTFESRGDTVAMKISNDPDQGEYCIQKDDLISMLRSIE